MQSLTVTRSETELATEAQAARRQLHEQSVARVNGRQVEVDDSLVPSLPLTDAKRTQIDVEYDDDNRHWSATSQAYAPADVLFQYLRDGWLLGDQVMVQVVRCFSRRCVEVYYFRLTSSRERVLMPVIANPVTSRLIMERGLRAIRVFTDCENGIDA